MLKKLNKFKTLLLLLGLLGLIPFYELKGSVNPPDSLICLKSKEFDFFAGAVVDRKQLKKDTVIYGEIIRSKGVIILNKNTQIVGFQKALVAKDTIAATYKREYLLEKSGKEKAEKRVNRLRNLGLGLSSAVVALLAVIALII